MSFSFQDQDSYKPERKYTGSYDSDKYNDGSDKPAYSSKYSIYESVENSNDNYGPTRKIYAKYEPSRRSYSKPVRYDGYEGRAYPKSDPSPSPYRDASYDDSEKVIADESVYDDGGYEKKYDDVDRSYKPPRTIYSSSKSSGQNRYRRPVYGDDNADVKIENTNNNINKNQRESSNGDYVTSSNSNGQSKASRKKKSKSYSV